MIISQFCVFLLLSSVGSQETTDSISVSTVVPSTLSADSSQLSTESFQQSTSSSQQSTSPSQQSIDTSQLSTQSSTDKATEAQPMSVSEAISESPSPETTAMSTSTQGPDNKPAKPIPESETSLVTISPIVNSEPETETESESESESESEYGIAEPTNPTDSPPLAEPGPDWELAKSQWSFCWETHLYFFGFFFVAIGGYCLIAVVRLWTFERLLSRKYFATLNSLIFGMCAFRAVYLLVDGYNSNNTYHPAVDYLMYGIGFPFLTSAFSILMFALLKATRMQMISRKVQRFHILIVIIVLHFAISITTDVVVGLVAGMRIMLLVCQLVFILWGLFLFIGYAYIFKRVYGSAVKRQSMITYSERSRDSVTSQTRTKPTLSLAVKITLSTAIFGLVTIGLEIYSLAGVYGIFSDAKPDPWSWFVYHTALRLTECLMCLTISYVASQPFRYKQSDGCDYFFLCAPCMSFCICDRGNRKSDTIRFSDMGNHTSTASVSMTSEKLNNQCNKGDNSKPVTLLKMEDGIVSYPTNNDINKLANKYNGIRTNSTDI